MQKLKVRLEAYWSFQVKSLGVLSLFVFFNGFLNEIINFFKFVSQHTSNNVRNIHIHSLTEKGYIQNNIIGSNFRAALF